MAQSLEFSFGTCNFRNLPDMSRPEVKRCAEVAGREADYFVGQEVAEFLDDKDIDAVLLPHLWNHYHRQSENVGMARRDRFAIVSEADLPSGLTKNINRKHLHSGLAHVTPGRDMTWTIQRFVNAPSWTPLAFVGSHFVSGVDSGKAPRDKRLAMRNLGFTRWMAALKHLHSCGVNIVFGLDSNWRNMPKVDIGQKWAVNDTIDKIGYWMAANSNYSLSVISQERHPNPSDHDYFVANFRATVRSRSMAAEVEEWLKNLRPPVSLQQASALRSIVG